MKLKLIVKKFIGKVWGTYCPECGERLEEVGHNLEKTTCPNCPRGSLWNILKK